MTKEARKPDFFIVGAPKAGTTSLYNYLTQHPDVFMPVCKEPYFFGSWREHAVGELQCYLDLFQGAKEDTVAGEASTTYLYLESAAAEIQQFKPDAKIIIILRNPVDRAYSQYWHHVRLGQVQDSFEQELEAEEKRLREGWRGFRPDLVPPAYYIESGRYSRHVDRYVRIFGREQVSVYLFEDLVENPESLCRDIFKFLEVDPLHNVSAGQVYNSSGPLRSAAFYKLLSSPLRVKEMVKQTLPPGMLKRIRAGKEWILQKNVKSVPEMNPETRAHLQNVFEDDIRYVQRLTGRDLSHWLDNNRVSF